ncbi:MAG: DUF3501 family protein [Alphaproteobacteria bacterium]|nr:DUF3501 family protein [Alphaproteobacteria bacterium]
MRPLTLDDVLDRDTFAAQRPRLHAEILRTKDLRRVSVGPNLTLLFENHATMLWQILEMCRVENISRPEAVQAELDAYNPLLPGDSELSATLLVEYPDPAERTEMLVKLSGLSRHLSLHIAGKPPVQAVFEGGRETEAGKISSVQFVRFPLEPLQKAAFYDFTREVRFVVDHPAYQANAALPSAQRGALIDDLRAD